MSHRAGIATRDDVAAIESRHENVVLPASTCEMIRQGAAPGPDAPALSCFLQTDDYTRPETWTYRQLLHKINQIPTRMEVSPPAGAWA